MYGIKWRDQYADEEGDEQLNRETSIDFSESEDLAVQSFKDDSDINTIMRRFGATGELPRSAREPFYGDFSDAVDYQSALNLIKEAEASFDTLPLAVKQRFGSNPAELYAFLQDPGNLEEAVELGIVDRPGRAVSEPPARSPEGPSTEEAAAE